MPPPRDKLCVCSHKFAFNSKEIRAKCCAFFASEKEKRRTMATENFKQTAAIGT
jgi:hypothetical protein